MLSFLPKTSSTVIAIRNIFLFESARAGICLVGFALIAEYLIPGSILASVPLFVGIVVVALLCLFAPIPERRLESRDKRYTRWKWLMPSLFFVAMAGLAVRDQGRWTWIVLCLSLTVLLAVVWTLAYDETTD